MTVEEKVEKFGVGAWVDEPDLESWTFEGVLCTISRHPALGSLCGYITVLPGHPWFRLHYDDINAEVHGGLTWSDRNFPAEDDAPEDTDPPTEWWLGFDCSHWQDFVPGMVRMRTIAGLPGGWDGTYRTFQYVRSQVQSLARQARIAAGSPAVPTQGAEHGQAG